MDGSIFKHIGNLGNFFKGIKLSSNWHTKRTLLRSGYNNSGIKSKLQSMEHKIDWSLNQQILHNNEEIRLACCYFTVYKLCTIWRSYLQYGGGYTVWIRQTISTKEVRHEYRQISNIISTW